jgi:hypothetical protein
MTCEDGAQADSIMKNREARIKRCLGASGFDALTAMLDDNLEAP